MPTYERLKWCGYVLPNGKRCGAVAEHECRCSEVHPDEPRAKGMKPNELAKHPKFVCTRHLDDVEE